MMEFSKWNAEKVLTIPEEDIEGETIIGMDVIDDCDPSSPLV